MRIEVGDFLRELQPHGSEVVIAGLQALEDKAAEIEESEAAGRTVHVGDLRDRSGRIHLTDAAPRRPGGTAAMRAVDDARSAAIDALLGRKPASTADPAPTGPVRDAVLDAKMAAAMGPAYGAGRLADASATRGASPRQVAEDARRALMAEQRKMFDEPIGASDRRMLEAATGPFSGPDPGLAPRPDPALPAERGLGPTGPDPMMGAAGIPSGVYAEVGPLRRTG